MIGWRPSLRRRHQVQSWSPTASAVSRWPLWFTTVDVPVAGAFLVVPPDPTADGFPAAARGFSRSVGPLPVPAVVIASSDDPYSSPTAVHRAADRWRAPLISVGARGHINAASGLGAWDEGRALLTAFAAGLGGHR